MTTPPIITGACTHCGRVDQVDIKQGTWNPVTYRCSHDDEYAAKVDAHVALYVAFRRMCPTATSQQINSAIALTGATS